MRKPTAFLAHQTRITLILIALLCFAAAAEAQHGGGGGHSGGGHSGGGHSSVSHAGTGHADGHRTGGHLFGWLHFGSRTRVSRGAGVLDTSNAPNASRHLPTRQANGTTPVAGMPLAYTRPIPLRLAFRLFPPHFARNGLLLSPEFRRRRSFFFGHSLCFHSSGCFFNGFTQMCFFEPALPLFFFSGFAPFLFGFPFDSNYPDPAGDLSSVDTMQPEIAPNPMAGPVDADTSAAEGQNSPSRRTATVDASPEAAKTDASTFFLLILKNGTRQAVTDYWLDDGYVEFVSDDSVRSHIPRDALDLKKTVIENSAAGLPFVLRSAPEDSR